MRQEMLPLLKEIASVLKGTTGEIVIADHTDNVPVSGKNSDPSCNYG